MRSLLPILIFSGCTLDNALLWRLDSPAQVPGDGVSTPDIDTDSVGPPYRPEDTGVVVLPSCEEEIRPAGPVPKLDECYDEGVVPGTFSPEILWTRQEFATLGGSKSCMMQPIVCSLTDDDGDGDRDAMDTPDVVLLTYSPGVLRALSGDDGRELWATSGSGTLQITGGAACGDLDNDGVVELVAASAGGVEVFDADGNALWRSTACLGHMDGTSDAPGLADLNHDGNAEVIIGNCILDASGNLVGAGNHGWGSSTNVGSAGFAVDIDQDGELEVVAGNALYAIDGTAIWYNGRADGYPAVGNFDGDTLGEIVVAGNAGLRIQDDDGTVLCEVNIPSATGSYGGPPTVADFDGDGEAEIGVAANSTYTVFESDCSVKWQVTGTTDPSSGNTASSVFDFEGDGVADVVYADEHWLWVFDGRDGSVKMQDPNHTNNTWLEYPSIADINADGSADIAVCNTPGSWGTLTGVSVFQDADQSWRSGRRIWNQHAYSITNVEDDGRIPVFQDTNWLSYNNFRSGDLTAGVPYAGPDLFVEVEDVCSDACAAGEVTVWYAVGNQGYTDVTTDVRIEVWGSTATGPELLGATTWTDTVAEGTRSASTPIALYGVPSPVTDLWIVIDGGASGGVVPECHEDNNVDGWGAYVCR